MSWSSVLKHYMVEVKWGVFSTKNDVKEGGVVGFFNHVV